MTDAHPFPRLIELARSGRRAGVPPQLSSLHGPVTGRVELPHRMFWRAERVFDLDRPFYLQWMYEIVLLEARSVEDLCSWLDAPTLHRVWPVLYLPHAVRGDWEARHPSLAEARRSSADPCQPGYEGWLARRASDVGSSHVHPVATDPAE